MFAVRAALQWLLVEVVVRDVLVWWRHLPEPGAALALRAARAVRVRHARAGGGGTGSASCGGVCASGTEGGVEGGAGGGGAREAAERAVVVDSVVVHTCSGVDACCEL